MPEPSTIERDLRRLESELKRLEAEYNMYFSGRLPRPPWETRTKVDGIVKQLDRAYIQNFGDRFRFQTMQSRYAAFVELWDRGMRTREEGRPGVFGVAPKTEPKAPARPEDKIVHVASFHDPMQEMDKLHGLYDSLVDARRAIGEESVPFHKFADLVKGQVGKLREAGSSEVAFRVAIKDGKVNFTARALKGVKE